MKSWVIVPRERALFRDARPFKSGVAARSLNMAWPSTTAGFVRTRLGMNPGGRFELSPDDARKIAVRGPWLVSINDQGNIDEHFFPAPADSVLFSIEGRRQLTRRRLVPMDVPSGVCTDFDPALQIIGFEEEPTDNPGKPTRGPAFWRSDVLQRWLQTPTACDEVVATDLGLAHLPRQDTIHVAIDGATQTALDGMLFSTETLRFDHIDPERGWRQLGLMVQTDAHAKDARLSGAPGCLGGERRLSSMRAVTLQNQPLAPCASTSRVRVVLLTPGLFSGGYLPGSDGLGKGVRVVAACVGRYQPISGWSFEHRRPKPSRRMAPAGSVYWLDIEGDASVWAQQHYFTSICDDPQDRRDGFGLIAVGIP